MRVLGNAGLDLRIELPRLPARGESLIGHNPSRAPGGKGLNQAVMAARAGAAVHLLAPLGDDAVGMEVAAAIAAESLQTTLPRLPFPTDYSLLMVLPDGENSITGAGPCAMGFAPDEAARFAALAAPGEFVLLQGNFSAAATGAALRAARAAGARTMFNPAPQWWDAQALLPLCDVVVANRGEAVALAGAAAPEALRAMGVALAIVTLGAEGCVAADAQGTRRFPAQAVAATDSTGCGDTFCGVLAAMLETGATLEAAIGRAQRAAAITATRPGAFASLPRASEL